MEILSQPFLLLAALIGYHVLFFWRWYRDPFLNSTGEMLSTFFPHWIWIGRQIRRGRQFFKDRIYYFYPACIPFLSTFYPPHFLSAYLSNFLSLDKSFILINFTGFSHYLLSSILSYFAFSQWYSPLVSLFGSVTMAYMAYSIKLQNPCIMYTTAWIPGCFILGPVGGLSLGMAILSGYWPLLFPLTPVLLIHHWPNLNVFIVGFLIGSPQIIPFLWYLPKSSRWRLQIGNNFGKVPIWKFVDFLKGDRTSQKINDLMYTEVCLYCGMITPFLILFGRTGMCIVFIISMMLMRREIPFLRIPARFCYLFSLSTVWIATDGLSRLSLAGDLLLILIILQGWSLLQNSRLYPLFPYSEFPMKPSLVFKDVQIQSGRAQRLPFPLFTGYIQNQRTLGYTGGFSLKLLSDFHHILDPNGERVQSCSDRRFLEGKFKGNILEELKWLA